MYFAAVERRQVRDPDRVVRGHTCHEEHPDSDDHIWLLGIGPRSGHDLPGRIAKRQAHSLWVLQRHQLKETTLSADTHAQPIGLTRSQILLPEEVAEILRSSRKKVLNEARKGNLPVLKFGKERRFLRDDVDEYIRRLRDAEQPDASHLVNQRNRL